MYNRTLAYFLLLLCSNSFGQIEKYNYKRELSGIKEQWHKIVLPDDIFEKTSPGLSDIRIYGISDTKDTLEAPYLLQSTKEEITQKEVTFNLINQAKNDKGYYFTFEIPVENSVNQLSLEFKQQNFDWRIRLEGSEDLKEWFTVVENYRILSIKNDLTDFQFTNITFPNSRYRYFRVLVYSQNKPELLETKIVLNDIKEGNYKNYYPESLLITEEKKSKQTILTLNLKSPVLISNLKLRIKDSIDYYRPIYIEYLSDSFKTEQGWKYNYITLASGTLNSLEKKEFNFSSTLAQKIKITIENQNNKALQIDSVEVKGYVYELVARFTDKATYYLTYGSAHSESPYYDIERFADKIPATLTSLQLGKEQIIEKAGISEVEPIFKNKWWLWSIMGFIIVLLGWFSINMMKNK